MMSIMDPIAKKTENERQTQGKEQFQQLNQDKQ